MAVWQDSWTAWGLPNCPVAPPTPFGYKGQTGAYADSESGLLLMGCRYYAPYVGRFLSRDPSGFGAGANLYGFCMADPVNFFDASGRFPLSNKGLWSGISSVSEGWAIWRCWAFPAPSWERMTRLATGATRAEAL